MSNRSHKRLTKTLIDQAAPGETVWDAEIRGFGVRITPSGVRSFILQYRTLKGEQGKLVLGRYPTMPVDEARRIAREHRVSIDKGGNPSRERQQIRAAPTLADYATIYCDVYGVQKPLRANTIKEARRVLRLYALPKCGRRKIADLVASDVRAMISNAREGSGNAQANRLLAVLSRMFNLAIEDDVRTTNPCKAVKKGAEGQRSEHLTPDHVRKLLAACDAHDDRGGANAVKLLLFTGARLREVLHAEWSQFDLEKGYWIKPSSHTKQKREHRLALAPESVAILREMRFERNGPYLFPGRSEVAPRHDLKRPWAALLKAAGIGHYRLHDLRRTTASFMISTQSDMATVGKALGHTQAQTTARYASLFTSVQRDGTERAVAAMLAA